MLRDYDPDDEVDVAGHAGALAAYAGALSTAVALGLRSGQRLPEGFAARDLVLGGLAAHKLARLLARSSVAAPLRAPFTEFEGAAGSSEHHESARGHGGPRHTLGELLTCPFCLSVWISTAYVAGLVVAPRPTRACAAVLTVTALSDALQHGYARLRTD